MTFSLSHFRQIGVTFSLSLDRQPLGPFKKVFLKIIYPHKNSIAFLPSKHSGATQIHAIALSRIHVKEKKNCLGKMQIS